MLTLFTHHGCVCSFYQVSTLIRKELDVSKPGWVESDFPRDEWRVRVLAERLDTRVFHDAATHLFDPEVSIPLVQLPGLFTEALATGDVKGLVLAGPMVKGYTFVISHNNKYLYVLSLCGLIIL